MKPFLIEKIVQPPLQIIVEDVATSAGKMFMKGKIQQTSVNQNNREYPKALWEQLFQDPDYLDKLKRGTLIGGIGHPKDGIFDAEKGCLVTRQMELANDEDVDGILEILLKHPHGMILGIYYESGVFYPVSSRGRGDSTTGNNGVIEVTPGTYIYEGHDAVIDPSVKDATPDYVKEALAKNENFVKYADLIREKITQKEGIDVNFVRTVKQLAPASFQMFHESTTNFKDLSSMLESKEEELTGTGKPKGNTTVFLDGNAIAEHVEKQLKDLEERIIKRLPEVKEESTQTNESVDNNKNENKLNKESMSEVAKTPQQLQEELTVANNKLQLSETTSKLTASNEKFEAAKNLLTASEKKLGTVTGQLTEEKKKLDITEKRFDASKKLLVASINKSKSLVTENAEWKSKYEAACKIIQGLQQKMESNEKFGIHKIIASEVAKFPESVRATAKKALSECKTTEAVQGVSESLQTMFAAMGDGTLPFTGNIKKENEDGRTNQQRRQQEQNEEGMDSLTLAVGRKANATVKLLKEQQNMTVSTIK